MLAIFILLLLVFITGFFVMSEIALVSARKSRLEAMAAKGDDNAKAALDLANNPEKFLSTATIGITLVSILIGVFAEDKFSKMLAPTLETFPLTQKYAEGIATTIVVIGVTFLSIIFGELIPKKFGLIRAEKIATCAPPPSPPPAHGAACRARHRRGRAHAPPRRRPSARDRRTPRPAGPDPPCPRAGRPRADRGFRARRCRGGRYSRPAC